jgi:hypothetical protein
MVNVKSIKHKRDRDSSEGAIGSISFNITSKNEPQSQPSISLASEDNSSDKKSNDTTPSIPVSPKPRSADIAASPNLVPRKIRRTLTTTGKVIKDLTAYYNEEIDRRLENLDVRVDQLQWIITEGDEDDKDQAIKELKKIEVEFDSILCKRNKFQAKLLAVDIKDMDANYELYEFVPKERIAASIAKYDSKFAKFEPAASSILCSKCKIAVNLTYNTTQCPHCYEDLNNRDVYTSNETNMKSAIDRKDTLEEAMDCFEGIQKRTFSKGFVDHIDRYLVERNIDPRLVSKETLRLIIKRGRYSEHFCDLNLLHKTYTGSQLPNITHLKSKLRHRNALMKEVYKELHPDHKGKYLHGQFLLKIMLQMEGFKYNKDDFSSELKMRNVTMRHNKEAAEVCCILKKRYPEMNWDFSFTI